MMSAALARAVRPGGTVAVIDCDVGTAEEQAGPGIARRVVLDELGASGLVLVQEIEDWTGHAYCLLFRKAGESTARGSEV